MTWWRSGGGAYGVFFNRDEKKTRSDAVVPSVETINGVKCLLPRDPDGGGTWLLSNEFGVTLAILNAYQATAANPTEASPSLRSRGELPLLVASSRSIQDVREAVARIRVEDYRPFTFVAVGFDGEAVWHPGADGEMDEMSEPVDQPLVSSSFRSESVLPARRQLYAGLRMTANGRERSREFHRLGLDAPDAVTPAMNRPDAQTQSICELSVDRAGVQCRYEEMPPGLIGSPRITECCLEF